MVLAEGKPKIELGDLPPEIVLGQEAPAGSDTLPLAELERVHILRALQRFGGNRKETARALGIGANTLWRKLRKYGVLGAQARSPGAVAPGRESRPRRASLPSATPRR